MFMVATIRGYNGDQNRMKPGDGTGWGFRNTLNCVKWFSKAGVVAQEASALHLTRAPAQSVGADGMGRWSEPGHVGPMADAVVCRLPGQQSGQSWSRTRPGMDPGAGWAPWEDGHRQGICGGELRRQPTGAIVDEMLQN